MKETKMKTKIAIAIAALGGATFAHGQTASLQDVVIIAKPIVEEMRLDGQSTTSSVVGEEQLKDLNAADLASALRRTPGVSIARYNPVGSFGGDQGGAVFIRGMGASRPGSEIKTYIDGVPFYMPVWNHPLLDMLPMNGMSSVTVNKSPQPHITGNNFASIHLETKRPVQEGVTGNVRASAGKFNTTLEQADISGKADGLEYSFAQGYAKSSGHRANADGQLNNAIGRIATKLNNNWTAGVSFLAVDTKAGDPGGDGNDRYNIRANSVSAFLQHQHADVNGEFRMYKNSGKSEWLYNVMGGANDFEMSGARWKESIKVAADTRVIAGVDYDTMGGKTPMANMPTFKITSPYGSIVRTSAVNADWSLVSSATLRAYQHNYYASSTSPALGFSLVSNTVTYFINASKGVNYAGLDGPALNAVGGRNDTWKNLKTEKADHLEVGAKFTPNDKAQIDISVFKDSVSDRYYNTGMGGSFFSTGAFTNQGGEATFRQQVSASWSAFVGASFLDPSISNLPYAPKRSYSVGLNGKAGPFKLAVDAQSQSDFYSMNWGRENGGVSASNTEKLPGFTVVNARVAYPSAALGKRGEYFVAVENLTNTSYAYTSTRPMPGRWAQVGLMASF
jgi:outer membrane receptor protein involved in Fe transport